LASGKHGCREKPTRRTAGVGSLAGRRAPGSRPGDPKMVYPAENPTHRRVRRFSRRVNVEPTAEQRVRPGLLDLLVLERERLRQAVVTDNRLREDGPGATHVGRGVGHMEGPKWVSHSLLAPPSLARAAASAKVMCKDSQRAGLSSSEPYIPSDMSRSAPSPPPARTPPSRPSGPYR
jgi:hypothetical protein